MATILSNGRNQFFKSDGTFANGWHLHTYIAGTTTNKATYSDSAGTVPNANPITLDARGEATIYWSGIYDVYLKDESGALIWGPVRQATPEIAGSSDTLRTDLATSNNAAKGAALSGFAANLAYANNTVGKAIKDRGIWVTDAPYNAKFDGITDDSAAIQAALDQANTNGGGIVYMPTGVANLGTTGLTIYQNVALVGQADAYVAGTRGTRLLYSGSGTAIHGQAILNTRLENFQLDCTNSTGSSVKGIYFNGFWRCIIRNVCVKGIPMYRGEGMYFDTALNFFGAYSFGAQHNIIENCECADGRVRFVGVNGSDGVTTVVVNTFRGLCYTTFHSQVVFINATAELVATAYDNGHSYTGNEWVISGGAIYQCKAATTGNAPPNATYWFHFMLANPDPTEGPGFWLDGSGSTCTLIGCDIEGNFPNAVAIRNDAIVQIISPIWAGFTGAKRVSGETATEYKYGGSRGVFAELVKDTPSRYFIAGDKNVSDYISDWVYPVEVTGGVQEGYLVRKRRIQGNVQTVYEGQWCGERVNYISVDNSPTTIFTINLQNSGMSVVADCYGWGLEGAPVGSVIMRHDSIYCCNDLGTLTSPVVVAGGENVATTAEFTGVIDGTDLLIKFNHGSTAIEFMFRIVVNGYFYSITPA